MRQLKPDELRADCDPASLPFRSTEELSSLDVVIGQERALSATTFGIGIRHHGYNLFALGPAATGKTTTMQRLLGKTAQDQPAPSDYCYVHNFTDPYRPSAIEMPAGRGRELRDEMARLVEECKTRLPRAFEGEEFERQKAKILEDLARRQEKEMGRLEETARAAGFALVRTPTGLAVAPAPEGKPLSHEEFEALSGAEKKPARRCGKRNRGEPGSYAPPGPATRAGGPPGPREARERGGGRRHASAHPRAPRTVRGYRWRSALPRRGRERSRCPRRGVQDRHGRQARAPVSAAAGRVPRPLPGERLSGPERRARARRSCSSRIRPTRISSAGSSIALSSAPSSPTSR